MDSKPTITARLLTPFLSGYGAVWLRRHERNVLEHGKLLDACQFEDALRVGVRHPEEVRVLKADRVPMPFRRLALLLRNLMLSSVTEICCCRKRKKKTSLSGNAK